MKTLTTALLLGLAVLCISTSSCKKKKGCMTPSAHNWDSDAKKDDGSCETCTDGILNGDEIEIDCGGKCSGSCWKTFAGPTTKNLYSAHFLDKNTGWICGDNGALYKTTNGGSSWTDLSLSTNSRMAHIYFVDASDGWAISSDGDSSNLMHTADGGISWNNVLSGNYYFFSDVEFVTTTTGYALAQYGTLSSMQESIVYKTTDGGNSWETDTLEDVALVSLFAVDANKVWLCGDDGRLRYTTDGAVTWNSTSGGTSMILTDMFIYGTTSIAVANQGNVICYLSDDGSGWNTYFEWDVQQYESVYMINENECWAVGTYPFNFEQGVIMYSNDGGATWEHQYPETNTVSNELHDIYFPDQTHGWIVGSDGAIIRIGY